MGKRPRNADFLNLPTDWFSRDREAQIRGQKYPDPLIAKIQAAAQQAIAEGPKGAAGEARGL